MIIIDSIVLVSARICLGNYRRWCRHILLEL